MTTVDTTATPAVQTMGRASSAPQLGVHSEVGVLRHGAGAPARPRAGAAHAAQQGRPAVRRRALGQARPAGARRLRRRARRARHSRCSRCGTCSAETIEQDDARSSLLDRTMLGGRPGPAAGSRRCGSGWIDAAVRRAGGAPDRRRRLRRAAVRRRRRCSSLARRGDFVLAPLPNHLFTRDTSAWVYDGVCVNHMAKPARRARGRCTWTRSTATTRCFADGDVRTLERGAAGRPVARGRRRARDRQRLRARRHGRAHDARRASSSWPTGCSRPTRRGW